jgi:hypothetical protein
MTSSSTPAAIRIRWPNGKITNTPIPDGAREIDIDISGIATGVR